jgi:nucleolar complex protein 2
MSEAESDGEDLLKEDSGDESEADNELDHKAQLDALKESDPAFYKFMQENDKDLLNFGGSDDELEVEEEDVDEDAVDKEDPEEQEGQIILTTDMITKWKLTMASDKSLRALKKLLIAFRAAVASAGDSDKDPGEFRYTIPSSAIFNSVMVAAMTYAPVILDYHLMVAGRNSRQYAYIYLPSRSGLPSASTKWKKLQPMVKSFLTNLLKALKIMTDSSMIQFSIQTSSAGEFHGALPLLACFPKLSKDYIKTLAGLWTQTGSSESEKVRIVSVIALRKLVVVAPAFIDLVLKV